MGQTQEEMRLDGTSLKIIEKYLDDPQKYLEVEKKRIQLLGGLIGICVAVVSLFYFFHAEKAEAEKNGGDCKLCESAVFHYTHYNESSESKSLLRAIESARQMSKNIKMETENGGQLREDFLKEKRCRRDKNMGWSGSC